LGMCLGMGRQEMHSESWQGIILETIRSKGHGRIVVCWNCPRNSSGMGYACVLLLLYYAHTLKTRDAVLLPCIIN
jgi:sugar phosphate permease